MSSGYGFRKVQETISGNSSGKLRFNEFRKWFQEMGAGNEFRKVQETISGNSSAKLRFKQT